MIDRRQFVIGAAAVLAAQPVMGESAAMVIHYQSWPFGEPRPVVDYYIGTVTVERPQPLSQLLRPHMVPYYKIVA
jgi:hypothetical protein